MRTRERRVRRLRLACRREEHARQARIRLEDALRTASLGDDARLIVVRRLDLGTLPLRSSATGWSRQVEQRFHRLRAEMVSVDHPSAAAATVVYFRDAGDPWLRLAERAAREESCPEWFWPKAAPGWHPQRTFPETLRLAFRALAMQSALAAFALVRRLAGAGRGAPLFQALQPEDVRSVLPAASGTLSGAVALAEVAEAPVGIQLARRLSPPGWLPPILAGLPPADAKALLAVAAALAASGTSLPSLNELALLSRTWRPAEHAAPALPVETSDAPGAGAEAAGGEPPRGRAGSPGATSGNLDRPAKISSQAGPDGDPDSRRPTSAGGLLFLVRLFESTGLPEALGQHPVLAQAGLPWRFFRSALRLARPAAGDALWALPDPRLPLPPGALWRPLLRAHHECRRLTTLSLRDLVRRPATVSLTETHVDVFFRLGDADARIRRAGLDVDPGWVLWLQRVVAFHYDRED
jgi:hypothetical protein